MANLALRKYQRNIENMIENHEINKALSHCLNILEKYPKEIETYRKLGKIFLEKPNMQIAGKIFNIILSVFPDDFVANVGLSFVAEQEKRWDDAIRSMEYAFEIQPANETLQDELKRLYNKRDGIEPAKIRLTRGALIRMYAQSNLHEQAIAEARLGLYEKPNRVSYKLILAEMFWASGKNIDAIQTCVEVSSQLPYCWTANEILYQAFLNFNNIETENYYQIRLVELNPYFLFMLPSTKSINDVPDIAVQIDDDISGIKDIENFDWDSFIDTAWNEPLSTQNKDQISDTTDWESILGEVFNEYQPAVNNTTSIEQNIIEDKPASSKKGALITRLQKRAATQNVEKSLVDNELQGKTTLLEDQNADSTYPLPGGESKAIRIMQEDLENQPDFPPILDESGIVDHDAPVMDSLEENDEMIAAAWAPDVDSVQTKEPSLDDTQQIRLLSESPDEIMLQSRKAIEGSNFQFALMSLRKLAEDKNYLEDIKIILEDACNQNPQESDLWLALGDIYQRLNLKEKALEVFIRAQKQISL